MEEAVEILERGWQAQHEKDVRAWNEHLERRRGSDNGGVGGQEQATPDNGQDSGAPEWLNNPTPSFLDVQPARHVLKRLEKKEFVELWHFTIQGCYEAATVDLNNPNDTFGLVHTDNGVVFQPVTTSSASSKVIRDEELSWEQLTEGKTRLLGCMKSCGWSGHEVNQLAIFFLNLDTHPIRSRQYGLQTIMRYQEMVRRHWTQALRNGKPYSIGTVNDDLLRDFQTQIGLEILANNNVSKEPEISFNHRLIFPHVYLRTYCITKIVHAPPRTCTAPHPHRTAPNRTHIALHRTRTTLHRHQFALAPASHHGT